MQKPKIVNAIDLNSVRLGRGAHSSMASGMCVMELASYLADEVWSDTPDCASPVIANFLRSRNDELGDDERQILKPYAVRVIGTRGNSAQELRRRWMVRDWITRTYTPTWLKRANVEKLTDYARLLEALPEITDDSRLAEAAPHLSAAQSAAWSAAWSAAQSAAWSAALELLRPTAQQLQQSALALLDRLIAVTAPDAPTGGEAA